ncbi:MAG: undecaprenyl-diphosphate phosphatase [Deinococcota bacterium]|jgi:undecaprenyl-diphosphatase|nr:undecaprenyl-diphosphate phosphatase [Deinococcota bacterium]
MTVWEALILGIVQGVTEFLPISSSGHLVIVQNWMGIGEGAFTFDAVIHFGSLLAVMVALRQELWLMLKGLFGGQRQEAKAGRRLIALVFFGTVPLVVVGLTLRDAVDRTFTSVYVSAFMLYLTGALLWFAERYPRPEQRAASGTLPVSLKHSLWMGMSQAMAVLPGLSRSGVTIATGMLAGLSRESAARFSFLLSIPAILGASLLELRTVLRAELSPVIGNEALLAGTLAAGISSYLAIAILLRFLKQGSLIGFAYYTWVLATVVLAISYFGQG